MYAFLFILLALLLVVHLRARRTVAEAHTALDLSEAAIQKALDVMEEAVAVRQQAVDDFLLIREEMRKHANRRETALKVEIEALKNENNRLTASAAVMGRNEAAVKEIDSFKKNLEKNPRLDGVLRGKNDG